MCFGGGNKTTSSVASDPRSFFRWWKPPEIETPTLKLNEEALDKQNIRKKREGMKRFQIPLASSSVGEGLGVPRRREGNNR